MQGTEPAELYRRTQDTTRRLEAEAAEILKMAQNIERLSKDTPARYAVTRARVEARPCWSRRRS